MTIRHLRIFVTVCREGSITKAGQVLFMAQPTVSLAISELEKHYGTRLFDRIGRRLYLTDAGQRLLSYAQHITSSFDEMEAGVKGWEDSGSLRLGTSITIGNCLLPDLLKAFSRTRPDVNVKIQIDNSEKIKQAVLNNTIDLGLIEGKAHHPLLISEPFRDDELVFLCAPSHRFASQSSIQLPDLIDEPFLMRERGSGGREILESALLLQDVEIEPAWESISTQAILQAVASGFGVAVLPLLLAKSHLAQGTLITRPIEGISLHRKFTMVYHKNKYLTSSAKAWIRLCHEGEGTP